MKLLLTNAYYLDENFDIKYGNILIENEKIKKITTRKLQADEIVDINKNLIMPGFCNMHTHSAMTLLRSIDDEKTLEDWLKANLKREAMLTPHDVYIGAKLGILNYIKNGITTFSDMYYYPVETAKASAELGTNGIIDVWLPGNEKDETHDIDKAIQEVTNLGQDYFFSCHSVYLRKKEDYIKMIDFAKKHNKIIFTHACETQLEVSNCKKKYHKTPIELLKNYGFFDIKNAIAHGVHLTKNDYKILKNSDTAVVSNPASNFKLGSGICPLSTLTQNNILTCLATDGPSSNNRVDMFREMYLASNLEKNALNNCNLFTSKETIKMATVNGALAFGLNNVGLIKEGFRADLIEINTHSMNFVPHNNLLNDLIYSASTEDIMMTIAKGKILYKDKQFLTITQSKIEKLFLEAEKIIKKFDN